MAIQSRNNLGAGIGFGLMIGGQTIDSVSLNTQYVFGVSGVALGVRFVAPRTQTLTATLIFVPSTTGSGNTITCELRAYATSTTPGSLLATATASSGSVAVTNKWVKFSFDSPVTLTAGVVYYLVFGNASADAATNNFALCRRAGTLGPFSNQALLNAVNSANGFSTGTLGSAQQPAVLVFGDGSVWGWPYTSLGNNAGTNARGLRIEGLPYLCRIYGVGARSSGSVSGLKIYSGSKLPNDTPDLVVSFDSGAAATGANWILFDPFTLKANTNYRIVLTISGATTSPTFDTTPDITQPEILAAMPFGGTVYSTQDSGSNTWSDDKSSFNCLDLALDEFGGGGSIFGSNIILAGDMA